MTTLLATSDTTGTSSDPARPDYAVPAYRVMAPRWTLVDDMREGTDTIRSKKEVYLPKFEAETQKDWAARVAMTFVTDHYATTLEEHVGLVTAEPIKLGKDVPAKLVELMEDVDGEGNHLDVFAASVLDAGMHHGHSLIFTDYPIADAIKTKGDERRANARPYATLYSARDVIRWRTESVGGVCVLVMLGLRETAPEAEGAVARYREITQAVTYDAITGRATGLGAITWQAWKVVKATDSSVLSFEPAGSGTIVGPARIPARVVYGGLKIGTLRSRPHLYGLAQLNIEETQVKSDYANVMHKCNVPTPVFIGRTAAPDGTVPTVQMGQGIDIPLGGDAKMLEPAGNAIEATRSRLQDLGLAMQRQGATSAQGEGGTAISATEAAQIAKARNAKVRRGARSLQDALEGMLADMAAFLGIAEGGAVKSGGSIVVNQNFAGVTLDPQYLAVLVTAYEKGTLTIEDIRHALQTGRLPETFDAADVLTLLADEIAKREASEPAPIPAAA
jgi:hypothetical protein